MARGWISSGWAPLLTDEGLALECLRFQAWESPAIVDLALAIRRAMPCHCGVLLAGTRDHDCNGSDERQLNIGAVIGLACRRLSEP